eukprot:PhM_4_TR9385/c0_g1_i1/m.46743
MGSAPLLGKVFGFALAFTLLLSIYTYVHYTPWLSNNNNRSNSSPSDDYEFVSEVVAQNATVDPSGLLQSVGIDTDDDPSLPLCPDMVTPESGGTWRENAAGLAPLVSKEMKYTHDFIPFTPRNRSAAKIITSSACPYVERRTSPLQCRYASLSAARANACYRKKSMLFIGNSHLRSVAREFANLLGMEGDNLIKNKHNSHIFEATDGTRIVFVWSPYTLRLFLSNSSVMQQIGNKFDHVFVNSGAWDMLFNDTDPVDYVERLHADLHGMRRAYPSASLTFMNVHMMHPANRTAMGKKYEMVTTCFGADRLAAYREMNRCAARGVPGLSMWDTYGMTRGAYGRSQALFDGHHYTRGVNVMMMRVMASRQCMAGGGCGGSGVGGDVVSPYSGDCAAGVPNMTRTVLCRSLRYHPPKLGTIIVSRHKTYIVTQIRVMVKKRVSRRTSGRKA